MNAEIEKVLLSAKDEFERALGGGASRGLGTTVENIAINGAAKLLETLLGAVPVLGAAATPIADPLIDGLAVKLEAYINAKVDAKLAALNPTGTVAGQGVGAVAAP